MFGQQRHRVEDADDGEPVPADVDDRVVVDGADPESLGGLRSEHDRRVLRRGRVEERAAVNGAVDRGEQLRLGRQHADATGLRRAGCDRCGAPTR